MSPIILLFSLTLNLMLCAASQHADPETCRSRLWIRLRLWRRQTIQETKVARYKNGAAGCCGGGRWDLNLGRMEMSPEDTKYSWFYVVLIYLLLFNACRQINVAPERGPLPKLMMKDVSWRASVNAYLNDSCGNWDHDANLPVKRRWEPLAYLFYLMACRNSVQLVPDGELR